MTKTFSLLDPQDIHHEGKNIDKDRAKRFLENSSFLVRVAIYFLVPCEEFKTEKILLPSSNLIYLQTLIKYNINIIMMKGNILIVLSSVI